MYMYNRCNKLECDILQSAYIFWDVFPENLHLQNSENRVMARFIYVRDNFPLNAHFKMAARFRFIPSRLIRPVPSC